MTGDALTVQLFIAATAVAVGALAITQAGWTHRLFVYLLFIVTIILALCAAFWPLIAPLTPRLTAFLQEPAGNKLAWFILGLIVGAITSLFFSRKYLKPSVITANPTKVESSIRLQFNPGTSLPLSIHEKNIWRWYSFAHIFVHKDAAGKEVKYRTWTIFLVFDKPAAIQQFKIDAGGAVLPEYEVKDYGPRHAIIFFHNDLSGVILDINALV